MTVNCEREDQCLCKILITFVHKTNKMTPPLQLLYLHLLIHPVLKIGYVAVDSGLVFPSTSNPPASVPCQPPYIPLFDHQRPSTVTLQHKLRNKVRLNPNVDFSRLLYILWHNRCHHIISTRAWACQRLFFFYFYSLNFYLIMSVHDVVTYVLPAFSK